VTKVGLSPLGRRFLPSITDLLFIGLLFTRLQPTLFYDGDTAWHLWAGSWFLDHGVRAIPDTLSFTRAGVPWASPQWLSEMLFALAYRRGAYMGVALITTAAFAAAFAWLYRQLARLTDHPPAAALVTILAAQTSMVQLVARPVVFTMPLFVGACALARAGGRRALVLGPLVTALWANLHPSAFLATGVLAYWAVARRDRQLALAAALSALALGATPWGFAWLGDLVPSGQNLSFFLRIDEWRTPGFREPKFWGLLATLLISLWARRGRAALAPAEALWGLGWLTLALASARMAPYAVVAWAPFLARDLAGWSLFGGLRNALAPVERQVRPGLWPALATILALVMAPTLARSFPEVAHGFSAERFPEAALHVADEQRLGPHVFNGYLWGGYLSWVRPDGRYHVLIDGRAGFFGDQVLHDYLAVLELRPDWQEVLARRRPDWILVPAHSAIANVAPVTGGWAMLYEDSTATILVPKSEAHR
jgi:hypothetical protein